jgi:hypothetical protein
MESLLFLFQGWGLHLLPAVPISLLIAFLGRHRVKWRSWEACVFIVPFLCWQLCYLIPSVNTKGMYQPFYELISLGFGAPIVTAIRVIFGGRKSAWPFSALLIAILSMVAILVAIFLPRMMPVD